MQPLFRVWFSIIALSTVCHAEIHPSPHLVLAANYPKLALFAGIEGTVKAKCRVRDDGSVIDVTIVNGPSLLVEEVESNLGRWVFDPPGKGDAAEITVTYRFAFRGYCDHHIGCRQESWFEYPDKVIIVAERPHADTLDSQ
ncbi:MAG: energy transducer TonB [Acidobacteria bacterium]|nr:energy transducer TonB [Acidobacteriota bacterium]